MSDKPSLKKRAPRVVPDVTRGEIVGVVEIAASPDKVFGALTNPSEVLTWSSSPERHRGEIVEMDAPRLLVERLRPAGDAFDTTVRYQLDPIDAGTRLTLRHDGFANRVAACEESAESWQRALVGLVAHVAPLPPTPTSGRFFCRLIPPRSTFPGDMTAEEAKHMAAHATYWRRVAAEGPAVAFGPVGDPAGAWGLGVLEANDAAHAEALLAADPIIVANLGFRYDKLPMFGLIAR